MGMNISDGCLLGVDSVTQTLVLENATIAAGAIISKDVDEGEFVRVKL